MQVSSSSDDSGDEKGDGGDKGSDGGSSSSSDDSGSDSSDSDDDDEDEVVLKFRNYNPVHKELKKFLMPRFSVSSELSWLDNELKRITESKFQLDEAILNIAPKKANWDLKRDAKPKLELVQKMTERCILELIAEKVKKQEDEGSDSDSGSSSGSD